MPRMESYDKRKTTVREHDRKTSSGEKTSVRKHERKLKQNMSLDELNQRAVLLDNLFRSQAEKPQWFKEEAKETLKELNDVQEIIAQKKEASTKNRFEQMMIDVPEAKLKDLIEYFYNRKQMWNKKEIDLSKGEIEELKDFQKALEKQKPELSYLMQKQKRESKYQNISDKELTKDLMDLQKEIEKKQIKFNEKMRWAFKNEISHRTPEGEIISEMGGEIDKISDNQDDIMDEMEKRNMKIPVIRG